MKEKTGGFDYFRLVAAFLVVAIHTSPLSSFSEAADYILVRVIARIAVPFFIMVTGYFLLPEHVTGRGGQPVVDSDGADRYSRKRALGKSLVKLLILYAVSILLYLPVNLYAGKLEGYTAWDYLSCLIFPFGTKGSYQIVQSLVFEGTFYHLWYFPGIIIGILLVVLLGRILPYPAALGISIVLYLIGLFGDNYYGLIPAGGVLYRMYDGIFRICGNTRNGILFVPVFLVLGAGIRRWKVTMKIRWSLFLLFYACMIVEGILLYRYGSGHEQKCMYIFLLPCMVCLIQLLAGLAIRPRPALRGLATFIYIAHPIGLILVRGIAKILHMEWLLIEQSLVSYLVVCAISFGGAVIYEMLWKRVLWRRVIWKQHTR